eukprot:7644607-Ditylum_brightwellii.AAC.1
MEFTLTSLAQRFKRYAIIEFPLEIEEYDALEFRICHFQLPWGYAQGVKEYVLLDWHMGFKSEQKLRSVLKLGIQRELGFAHELGFVHNLGFIRKLGFMRILGFGFVSESRLVG